MNQEGESDYLHSISSFGERFNDEFLILLPPSPEDWFGNRINDGPDELLVLLSALIVERHSAAGKARGHLVCQLLGDL